jgi:hypothetical protein
MKSEIFIKYSIPIFIALNVLRMFREMYWLYYLTQLILLLFILALITEVWRKNIILNRKTIQIFLFFIFFPVWATLTAFWSLNPLSTLLKGMNFVFVVTGLFSALMLWIKYVNGNFFELFLPANLLVVSASIFSLLTGTPEDAWNVGHGLSFAGFFAHQNVLGMSLMFTLPGVFGLLKFKPKSKPTDNNPNNELQEQTFEKSRNAKKYFFFILLALNLFLIAISYSRSVILSLSIGFIFYLIITKAYRMLIGISGVFVLTVILYISVAPANQFIYKILSKHGWDILATRTYLWGPSYEAARIGGVNGIGYGMSAPGIYLSGTEDIAISQEHYYREKGNSALALIEETGLIGILILFILICLWFRISFEARKYNYDAILISLVFTFIVQSNFEGWVGGGSPLLQIFIPILIYVFLKNNIKIRFFRIIS